MIANPCRSSKNEALRFTKAALKDTPRKSNNNTADRQMHEGQTARLARRKMLLLETIEVDM